MRYLSLLTICLSTLWISAGELSIERIYQSPSLTGPAPASIRFSPDGARITFLRGKAQDAAQLDLWEYHIEAQKTRLLVDSTAILSGEENLSAEEIARRERKRMFSRGIVSYSWSHDGKALLFPLGGNVYYFTLDKGETRQLTNSQAFDTDIRFSPKSNFVSLIRNQDLYVVRISDGREIRITHDGGGVIKNGMAEFVAQEEIDRYTGYWWAPNESRIAYVRVDESPVDVVQRYEIHADSFTVYDQRYPAAGTPNVHFQVYAADLLGHTPVKLDLGPEKDQYLTRAKWLPDSKHLSLQRMTRNQQHMDLLFADVTTGKSRMVLSEKSDVWLNVNDHLHFLRKSPHFVWGSERDGFLHLYLYDYQGKMIRRLTDGPWVVNKINGIDPKEETLFLSGNRKTALENHLYRVNLKGEPRMVRITQGDGTYKLSLSGDCRYYIAAFSNPTTPPRTSLHDISGKLIHYLEKNELKPGHPYYPYLKHHVTPEFGTLKAADGQDLYYRIFKPKLEPGKRYPVIVDVYGGPHAQRIRNSWSSRNDYWSQHLTGRGYVVFSLDNRGSGNRGTAFEFPIYKQLGEVETADQKLGVEYLKTLNYIDPNRVGVFGWSYGGYMALMLLGKEPNLFQAGVSVAPVTDWGLYDTFYTERYLGHPAQNEEGYVKSNVFPYLDGIRAPLLNIHGMADDNVLFTNSTKLYKTLQDKDIPFEMMDYPGEKHSISRPAARIHLFKHISRFFDRTLGPGGR